MIHAARRPRYYGWTIIWTLAVTETVTWGILFYAFSVFLVPMQQELGWSPPQITGAYSLALLVAMALSVPLGRWLDRSGPRLPMTIGSILGTLLLLAWSRVESLPAFYAVWAGMGVAMALALYEPAFAVVSAWFARGRSRALLILTTVAGFASTIFLPLAGWLTERFGWREALVVLAVILGVLTIPAHALILRRRPEDLGLLPDGEAPAADRPLPAPEGVTMARALRDPAYWWLTVGFFLGTAASVAIGLYLIPILLERGDSLARATLITGLIGAAQAGGRVVITAIDRRIAESTMGVIVFALQAIAMAMILRHGGTGHDPAGGRVAGHGPWRHDPAARHPRRRPLRPGQLRHHQRHPRRRADGRPRRGPCRRRHPRRLAGRLRAHAADHHGDRPGGDAGDGPVCIECAAVAARVRGRLRPSA